MEIRQFFKKRGYLDSAVTTGEHRAHEIDRETTLQTSQNEETNRIPFTLSYHPQNLAVKNVLLKNFKILRNDPETKQIFPLAPLVSFKRDKNIGNYTNRELSNVHAHDPKLVLSFLTWLRSPDGIDLLKSLTTLYASPQMSSIA